MSALVGRRVLNCLWELTYRCTARCRICSYWKNPSQAREEMLLPEIREGLNRAFAYGCRLVNFTGGEPTIRQDLEAIVNHASSVGMWTSIVTNGTLLTRERIVALKDAGLDSLFVSMDSASAAAHEEQRGVPGLHGRVLQCLEWVQSEFLTGHRTGGIMCVMSRENTSMLTDVMQLAERLGVYVLFQPYHINKTGNGSLTPDLEQCRVNEILRFKRTTGCILNSRSYLAQIPLWLSEPGFRTCHAGLKYFSVDPFGYVHPCVDLPSAGHILDDSIGEMRTGSAQDMVRACRGCWYCFRGEADTTLSLSGCLEKIGVGLAVLRRNAAARNRR